MKSLLCLFCLFAILPAMADETSAEKPAAKRTDRAVAEASSFRCEKVKSVTLAEFKAKLVENCDLNKPFSSSLSAVVADETYLYCCHTK